ncbi:MAG: hypothetical protein PHI34_10975 [Acidobacteriota bacterium]|nr:hypothetical protein [Acidobacteriota bacterium]
MIRRWSIPLLLLCLAVGLAFPVLFFLGRMDAASCKTYFLIASAAYFVFAVLWASAKGEKKNS